MQIIFIILQINKIQQAEEKENIVHIMNKIH